MSFDWSDYLTLAQDLEAQAADASTQEAMLRSAISRAYYAAFCRARNHLRASGYPVPAGGRMHGYVRDQFITSSDRVRKEVGIHLDRLRIDRNRADYDDTFTGLAPSAKVALRLAGRVLSNLDNL